jgi:gliding motility-associated-like protein
MQQLLIVKISIVLLMLLPLSLAAQTNLLLNGDFEDYSGCPTTVSYPAQAPNYEITKCIGWTVASYGTSDYYNICGTPPFVSVPSNGTGYQQPYSGNGYVGGLFVRLTGGAGDDGYSGLMWWEYVQGQFVQPLEAGRIYKIKFYISLAEYSDLMIKEIGAYISHDLVTSPNTASLNLTPQLKFTFDTHFSDTINWVPVEGIYIATGGEKYMTIGNFNSDVTTDTLRRYWIDPPPLDCYFYIDGAGTFDVTDEFSLPNVFTPNGDGVNDYWSLPVGFSDFTVTIYNRWGGRITESNGANFWWDGRTDKGIECTDGVYYYVIANNTNTAASIKGFVQLMR